MSKTLLALYGLKYNPFAPGVPTEALQVSPRIASFRPAFAYACVSQGKR